ncbi:uncharacterized protein TM35_000262490, partial [Trypanosoma theileri]
MSSKTKSKSNISAKQRVQDHTDAKPPQPTKEITTTTTTTTTTTNTNTNITNTITSVNSSSTVKSISTAAAAAGRTLGCCGALLVIGTYHSVMAGLVFRRDRLALLFSIKHHDGCINTIAVGDKYIASAGTDERVFLFTNKNHQSHLTPAERAKLRAAAVVNTNDGNDRSGVCMRVRPADLGSIAPPSEVRCLLLTTNGQQLLCGCTDGQLIVYRTRDWSVTLAIPLHEKCVNAIAVHPGNSQQNNNNNKNNNNNNNNNKNNKNKNNSSSGVLAVTVGSDRHVAVVDLARGRLLSKWRYNTHTNNTVNNNNNNNNNEKSEEEEEEKRTVKRMRLEVRDEPHAVHFSPSGCYFAILAHHSFTVYETATTRLLTFYQEA